MMLGAKRKGVRGKKRRREKEDRPTLEENEQLATFKQNSRSSAMHSILALPQKAETISKFLNNSDSLQCTNKFGEARKGLPLELPNFIRVEVASLLENVDHIKLWLALAMPPHHDADFASRLFGMLACSVEAARRVGIRCLAHLV